MGHQEYLHRLVRVPSDLPAAALPGATHRRLPGERPGVPDDILAPALTEWSLGEPASAPRLG